MKFAIVVSRKDPAGMNIVKKMEEIGNGFNIFYVESEIVYAENIDKKVDADFIIFASKHQSVKKVKTLTVHPIGNWKNADFGGKDRTICPASALIIKHFFQTLDKNAESVKKEYQVSLEATHHGPYVETPCLFIEVGSSKEEWEDLRACEIVAKTINDGIKTFKREMYKIAFGIGGPHYCPNFNEIQLGNKIALSHIIAEYGLPLNEQMIKQIINKTKEKVECVVVDWKGLGNAEQRKETIELLKKFELKVVRTKEVKR